MTVSIEAISGPMAGRRVAVADGYDRISIGRHPRNHFVINEPLMSRFHCILEIFPPYVVYVHDTGSRNGVFLGRPDPNTGEVRPGRIENGAYARHGDLVRIGASVLRISCTEPAAAHMSCHNCGKTVDISHLADGRASMADSVSLCSACADAGIDKGGRRIGPLVVLRKLGEGGMASVYLARHAEKGHLYAIKIAHPAIISSDTQKEKFLREATTGTRVKHPHIVRYYGCGYVEEGNFFYIGMEYVDGIDLDKFVAQRGRALLLKEAKPLLLQLLDGLGYLHQHRFVHRDIKPSNILLCRSKSGVVAKLGDFGLAKNFEQAGLSGLTLSNRLLGTPHFMAPEQCCNARDVGPAADIYAMAATAYFALTREKLFQFSSMTNMLARIFDETPMHICELNPQIPRHFGDALMQCVEKDPQKRIPSAAELRTIVEAI